MADVFIVDDDRDSADMLVLLLQLRLPGLRFKAFYQATDALAALQQHRPGAIVSDLQMPGMDGHAFARAVLDACTSRPAPVLLAVSGDSNEVAKATKEGLFARIFLKPVSTETMIALLRPLFT